MKTILIKLSGLLVALLLPPFVSANEVTVAVTCGAGDYGKTISHSIDGGGTQYVGKPQAITLSDKEYEKSYLSLKYLEGLYINIDDVLNAAKQRNVDLKKDLRKEITQRLKKANVKLLTKDEMEKALGKPQLSFYPTFPAHLSPSTDKKKATKYRTDCCTASIWTSFLEGVNTLRDPVINYKISTWGEGHTTNSCSDVGGWLTDVVLKTLDNFLADKAKAEQEYEEMKKKKEK